MISQVFTIPASENCEDKDHGDAKTTTLIEMPIMGIKYSDKDGETAKKNK